jgi:hypothetical protein
MQYWMATDRRVADVHALVAALKCPLGKRARAPRRATDEVARAASNW